jgi:hypothetical protein
MKRIQHSLISAIAVANATLSLKIAYRHVRLIGPHGDGRRCPVNVMSAILVSALIVLGNCPTADAAALWHGPFDNAADFGGARVVVGSR